MPHIVEIYRVTGEDCFVLKALVPAPEDLAAIVDAIGRFGAVTTCVVLQREPPKPLTRQLLSTRSP
jgi:Lrp/AsnC family leucine-responsive transcriptional regulator